MHPTVKPTALVIDAIKDSSRRGEIVLDAFCGVGHHHHGRASSLAAGHGPSNLTLFMWMYRDPPVAVLTGQTATMAVTGETFAEMEERRQSAAVAGNDE